MSAITTHVLDTSLGRPAAGVAVVLERLGGVLPDVVSRGVTDTDGRLRDLTTSLEVAPGDYRLRFDTGAYFEAHGVAAFYPEVAVHFRIDTADQHYHVPLLLSPFGYSTYRGS